MIFAVFDPSPLTTVCINCIFLHIYLLFYCQIQAGYLVILYRTFLKMNTRHQAHKPVKKCNYWGRFSKRNGQTASACQISWQQVQTSLRYGDFSIFQDGGRRHFWTMKFVTVGRLKRIELHRRAKFGRNRSNCGRDTAIFRFQDGSRPPSWFVVRVFGPPTKGIWWSLSLCKISLESVQ